MAASFAACGGGDADGDVDLDEVGSPPLTDSDALIGQPDTGDLSDLNVERPVTGSFIINIPQSRMGWGGFYIFEDVLESYFDQTGVRVEMRTDEQVLLTHAPEEIDKYLRNTPPDLFFTYNAVYTDEHHKWAMDIEDSLRSHAPNFYASLSELEKAAARDAEGRMVQMPIHFTTTNRQCVVINKKYADKYAPSGVRTLDEYEEFMRLVKEGEDDVVPGNQTAVNYDLLAFAYGYCPIPDWAATYRQGDPSLTPTVFALTDDFRLAVERVRYWKGEGLIEDLGGFNETYYDFLGGRTASLVMELSWVELSMARLLEFMEIVIYPLYPNAMAGIEKASNNIAIHKDSQKAKEVCEFIEWVYSSQGNYDFLMYGWEGFNYDLVGGKLSYPYGRNPIYANYQQFIRNIDLMRLLEFLHDGFIDNYTDNINTMVLGYYRDGALWRHNEAIEELMKYLRGPGSVDNVKVEELIEAVRFGGVDDLYAEFAEAAQRALGS